jgi:hypothetical protein
MRLRVREQGDEVHVDVDGVAGRQLRVLQALSECRRRAGHSPASALSDVHIRSGASRMHIRVKGHDELRLEAATIYRCLREALVDGGPAGGALGAGPEAAGHLRVADRRAAVAP